MKRYILNAAGDPVECPDLLTWARWYEDVDNRSLRTTDLEDVWISTIFLGFDHSFGLGGPPVLWETMVFAKEGKKINFEGQNQWRYTARLTALQHHDAIVEAIRVGRREIPSVEQAEALIAKAAKAAKTKVRNGDE